MTFCPRFGTSHASTWRRHYAKHACGIEECHVALAAASYDRKDLTIASVMADPSMIASDVDVFRTIVEVSLHKKHLGIAC